jgi:hypothetical protein
MKRLELSSPKRPWSSLGDSSVQNVMMTIHHWLLFFILASGLQLVGAFQVSSNFLAAEFSPAAQ